MTHFDWQEQLKSTLPPEWLATQGKGVKIAVLDSGLNLSHPAFKHFGTAVGHRYNATLPGDRLLFGGNDDVSEQKTDHTDHGTPCLSIISGVIDGVFKGIAPLAEIFVIKISRKAPGTPFELFQAPDFLNGLKIANALNVDFAVAALTYSRMKLKDFNISKDLADQTINTLSGSKALLFSSIKNYHVFVEGEALSAKYFPTWNPQSINCGYVPEVDIFDKLIKDTGIQFFWDSFKPVICNEAGEPETVDVSTSFATYATAGVAALALAQLKATEKENYKPRSRSEMLDLLKTVSKPVDSVGAQPNLNLLHNQLS
ncbi:MAG: S8 family serine peptidase [Haliscomenobacter sp.]|nr:S8 family serine peptidase [Haliscomenobacter sp.]MBK9490042.1 S8 family serine peptidase [Haliscomenobacter sp.]